jgi:hypothetical protein
MTIVRCPRCRDEVSVPAKATGRALVRCPLCLEQYLLAEAMAGAPPALVIIGGEVEQASIEPAAADEIEYRIAGGYLADDFVGRAPAGAAVKPARPMVRPVSRPKKKEKNGLVLIVNYVLGGALGLALGLLLLWWGFRRDPLELGPTVAEYAPWIVPARFQGKEAGSVDGATTVRIPEVAVSGATASPNKKSAAVKEQAAELQSGPVGEEPAAETVGQQPMPDLRDLLPEGFSE